ncbi:hypothetical protein ACIRPX_40615 [Streptomyces sp. NPDC101225]|uniref:hypothetical protein n=1 Tax=Streptomyces sp. NPDC101225 TaxID=3366135 RepID=UPI00382DB25D
MGYAGVTALLLIAGAAGAAVILRRARGAQGRPGARGASGLDAEAEAHRLLLRLAAGLAPPDAVSWAGADASAGRALTEAATCHRGARALLADARTTAEYERAARLAQEGLRHVRTARAALEHGAAPADGAHPAAVPGGPRGLKGLHSAFPRS